MIKKLKSFMTDHLHIDLNRSSQTKNSYYTELLETFDRDQCVICKLLKITVVKYLENLLHEFTMDPVSRREIREAFGYCEKHTAQLIEVTKNTNQRLSASIVAEDLANHFLRQCRRFFKGGTGKSRTWKSGTGMVIDVFKKRNSCPICKYYSTHEKMYVSEFSKGSAGEEFLEKFVENSGICIEHLFKVSRIIKDPAALRKILEPQMAVIEEIDLELNDFVKKFDHKSSEKITDTEASAWIRLFNRINST